MPLCFVVVGISAGGLEVFVDFGSCSRRLMTSAESAKPLVFLIRSWQVAQSCHKMVMQK